MNFDSLNVIQVSGLSHCLDAQWSPLRAKMRQDPDRKQVECYQPLVIPSVVARPSMEIGMWTDISRAHHARDNLRLPSDLTDREWTLNSPHLPPRSRLVRPRRWSLRRITEALLFLLNGELPRRMRPPRIFPPPSTVQRSFHAWRDAGACPAINHALVLQDRARVG